MSDSENDSPDSESTRIEPSGDSAEGATRIDAVAPSYGARAQPASDLGADRLLRSLPRASHEGVDVPALAGIHILRKLGQGGMGAVYLGWKPLLRQHVAVKVLPLHLAELQPQMIDRFVREAQIAASVESKHLVRVVDVGDAEGLFYLVMEYVEGGSAGSLLRSSAEGRLQEAQALETCIAATRGLAAAHSRGIIHRDIKPDNIMVPFDSSGRVLWSEAKLADLGLARSEELGQSLTGTQAGMGTPGYMAPEQAMSAHKARKPADVFGMGATLYALLSGRSPFAGESSAAVMLATIQQPHTPIHEVSPSVSAATAALLDITLAKDPAERYVDASALLEALEACLRGIDGDATVVDRVVQLRAADEVGDAVRSTSVPPATAATITTGAPATGTPRRLRWLPIITGLLTAVLVIWGGWRLLRDGEPEAAVSVANRTEIVLLDSSDGDLWLPWAVEEFMRSDAGRGVAIEIQLVSDREAIERISNTSQPVDVWFPSAALADEELHEMSEGQPGKRAIESSVLVALSPQVIVLFQSRYDALLERYGAANFAALQQALEQKSWEDVASRPEWGRVSFAMTDPTRYSSGIISVLLLAAELDHRDRTVTLEDLRQPRIVSALEALDPALRGATGAAGVLREMILKGPSAWDGVVVSEALAISHIAQLEGRWEQVRLVYPHVNYWSEHTLFTVGDPQRSAEEREALAKFAEFLRSRPVQTELMLRGLRPANPEVGIRGEESPFMKQMDSGVKIEVPITLDPPEHEVIDAIYRGYWRDAG